MFVLLFVDSQGRLKMTCKITPNKCESLSNRFPVQPAVSKYLDKRQYKLMLISENRVTSFRTCTIYFSQVAYIKRAYRSGFHTQASQHPVCQNEMMRWSLRRWDAVTYMIYSWGKTNTNVVDFFMQKMLNESNSREWHHSSDMDTAYVCLKSADKNCKWRVDAFSVT